MTDEETLDPNGLLETLAPDAESEPKAPEIQAPVVVAERYTLVRKLGTGGMGEVWLAHDGMLDQQVALKRMLRRDEANDPRFRREIRALRLLDLPGVVKLRDEGLDGEGAFLVMELVRGSPFPGAPLGRQSWDRLRPVARQLLATMERVHAAGLVHRDLKPANVLVDFDRRVRILDFGLSAGHRIGSRMTLDGALMGTPAFMAPEQVKGERATARADLYAIGVMLFEALTGRVPFPGRSPHQSMRAKLQRAAPTVAAFAPDVPKPIARLIDRLLAQDPSDRPKTARAVLSVIDGFQADESTDVLPMVGRDGVVKTALGHLRRGEVVELLGPPGVGRSRVLFELRRLWEKGGGTFEVLSPGQRAFESLGALAQQMRGQAGLSLGDAHRWVVGRLTRMQAAGTALFVDDEPRLDRHTRRALDALPPGPRVLVVEIATPGAHSVALGPLTEAELKPLFLGAERLFHIPTDAATLLYSRSGGNCRRMTDEVEGWVEQGLASWDMGRVSIDRSAIDRLEAMPPAGAGRLVAIELDPEQERVLAAISSAWSSVGENSLAEALGRPLWEVQSDIEALEDLRLVRRNGGRIEGLGHGTPVPVEEQAELHRGLAKQFESGDAGRLFHLAMAGDAAELATEALTQAAAATAVGRYGRARGILASAVAVARDASDARAEARLLRAWLANAMEAETGVALDEIVYELCRASASIQALLAPYLSLARATISALVNRSVRAVAEVDAIPPFNNHRWELRRLNTRVLAARKLPVGEDVVVVEASVAAISAWSERAARSASSAWLGRLRYRQSRFDEAAEHQLEAARWAQTPMQQIGCTLWAASCLIEAGAFSRAVTLSERAASHARGVRSAYHEGRAEMLGRMAAYRQEVDLPEDSALLQAVELLDRKTLSAMLSLTEAAFAWRRGRFMRARSLAAAAAATWGQAGLLDSVDLAFGLLVALGIETTAEQVARTITRLSACAYVGHASQVAGLLIMGGVDDPRLAGLIRADVAQIAEAKRGLRQEVLSPREAMALLG